MVVAKDIMQPLRRGHVCTAFITVRADTAIDAILEIMNSSNLPVLPVVNNTKHLVGLISKKNIINAIQNRPFAYHKVQESHSLS
ncbi:MAG: CBS domain-containing protein [Nitrospirota bacterium]